MSLRPSQANSENAAASAAAWLAALDGSQAVDGLVQVAGYSPEGRPPEEVLMMEKAAAYQARAVFFEASAQGKPPTAQAFIFTSEDEPDDMAFARVHKRLWSWGGVPLAYRRTPGLIQLFRCAHDADFVSASGALVCKPIKTLSLAALISANDAWWDAQRLRNGTVWDDPSACKLLLSSHRSAHRRLVDGVKRLHENLNKSGLLNQGLRRRLLILCLLIAYLDERGALPDYFFGRFVPGATQFFHVLADGPALIRLLEALEGRFNGHVFSLDEADRAVLSASPDLAAFSRLIEAREDEGGQLALWSLYSFRDLPVEVISHIYQLFVSNTDSSVYTPPALVRLMLEEALSWSRIDRLIERQEVILDPACGSGVFLVEAYKRLILHWRSRNNWRKINVAVLKQLLEHIRGVDLEQGAIELAAFSLCLALCDALQPEEIRASVRLFPKLAGRTLLESCFFEAKEKGLVDLSVGVVVGNPPFESKLRTEAAKRSYERYVTTEGPLADKQVAYLFLYESMLLVAPGGVLSMLQQYNLIYNLNSESFRRAFFTRWDVREVLDFVSIRGLFNKGGADTKIVAIVAQANEAPTDRKILHAVFRRGARAEAEQGFDIDFYDLHWLPRDDLLKDLGPDIWRSNLLGGARTRSFVKRLRGMRTLRDLAEARGWAIGEGFIDGAQGISRPADHLTGQPLLPSLALTEAGIDRDKISSVPDRAIEGPRTAALFTPPMLLIREHEDLPHATWTEHYLAFRDQIFGVGNADEAELARIDQWMSEESIPLRAYIAGISRKLFTQRATSLGGADVGSIPMPDNGDLDLGDNERIVADDVVRYYRNFVRRGADAELATADARPALPAYVDVFCGQTNGIYRDQPLKALEPYSWPGVICQPFAFGEADVDWSDAGELRGKLDAVLREQRGSSLSMTRIARIYDGRFIFMLKPDRLRYWLRSIALRDSDDVLADMRAQGF